MTYLGVPGGPSDPSTPGPYCLARCYCGSCPQYAEQARHAEALREQERNVRLRRDATVRRRPFPDTGRSNEERFLAFHAANPHVYDLLVRRTAELVRLGHRRIGIGALFEQLRHDPTVSTEGEPVKCNNTYRALYVRMLLAEHPEWRDLFELRQRKAA